MTPRDVDMLADAEYEAFCRHMRDEARRLERARRRRKS